MTTSKKLKFRPYARLLTMLGDQLIRSEQIALAEIIKNSYDADASWVKVTFEGFDAEFHANSSSRIIIEDDGHGMTTDVIEGHWVNPATPLKLLSKKKNKAQTFKGRVIQGEKGIGRFALLKLGRDITIITRPTRSKSENILKLDLSGYDTDFITDANQALFLDDLSMNLRLVEPAKIIVREKVSLGEEEAIRAPHGTRIEIGALTTPWSRSKVAKVFEDLTRLQSIFDPTDNDIAADDADGVATPDLVPDKFQVLIYRGKQFESFSTELKRKLDVLLQQQSVFHIKGRYDQDERAFDFTINDRNSRLALSDPEISGLVVFREYLARRGVSVDALATTCGSFNFAFYVFDFSADAKGKYLLDKDEKGLIKEHRIYLYRDGIRVYPYGDPDDDWLLIDVRRGTVRASEFLSNDQVVGYVNITQAENPELRDKTSREGLVDTGHPVEDFRSLLQGFLAWVRKDPYTKYKIATTRSRDIEVYQQQSVQKSFDEAVTMAQAEGVPAAVREKISAANQQYKAERRYLVQRAETTEHLAGVGLSVEAASHDLMLAMQKVLSSVDSLMVQANRKTAIDPDVLRGELTSMRGLLSFIESQMKDMQLLFKSTKQRRKDIRIIDIVEKVKRIFGTMLQRHKIEVRIEQIGSPLVAKTTDAVLLQLFLNLFDNAVYWLEGSPQPREIEIQLDGDSGTLTFADSGPGFRSEDLPFVFEPFFSGKGEEGRGLGLYIARQLLERHEYAINVANKKQRVLEGANLVVSFITEDA